MTNEHIEEDPLSLSLSLSLSHFCWSVADTLIKPINQLNN
jgi:hypothetical protein